MRKSRVATILLTLVLTAALTLGLGACGKGGDTASTNTGGTKVSKVYNPLTGDPAFSEDAVGQRPVAIVVENTPDARPQWGIDDPEKAPDIILEGEVEGGITRTLWFFADINNLPERVGPLRSARPPYIKFSELFDAYFVHIGMSHSDGNYVGANDILKQDKIDDMDGMFGSDNGLYDRDETRNVAVEHTSFLYGSKLPAEIKSKKFRTDIKEESFTRLPFKSWFKWKWLNGDDAKKIELTFSAVTATRVWEYNEQDEMYHTQDFATDVKRDTIIVLFDDTDYINVPNYKNTGVTYCNYLLAGGNGKIANKGTVIDIKWSVKDGKLNITDKDGKCILLPQGKSWIGWASANHDGAVVVTP